MAAYWTNFVKNGDPNGPALPHWPAFGTQGEVLRLDAAVSAGALPGTDKLRIFDSVYDALRSKPISPR